VRPRSIEQHFSYLSYTWSRRADLLRPLAAAMAEEPFKLLIMDSITANLRVDYSGRGELAERQQKLGQLLACLKKIAEEFNDSSYLPTI